MTLREFESRVIGSRHYKVFRDNQYIETLVYIDGLDCPGFFLSVGELIVDGAEVQGIYVTKRGYIEVMITVNNEQTQRHDGERRYKMAAADIIIESIKRRVNIYNRVWRKVEYVKRLEKKNIILGLVIGLNSVNEDHHAYSYKINSDGFMFFGYYDKSDNWHTIVGEEEQKK